MSKAIILESPYTSLPDVAARTYFFVPVHLLMKDRFDNLSKIEDVTTPLLILQGANDKTIPPSLGEKLFDAANKPKEIERFEGFSHNDLPIEDMANKAIKFIE